MEQRAALVDRKLDMPSLDATHVDLLMENVRAFFERIANPPAKKVAWRPLLRKLAGPKAIRRAASARTLAALEKRLGVTLPPSYKAFLATSNGLAGERDLPRLSPRRRGRVVPRCEPGLD